MVKACDRAVRFGARCPNDAEANGRCKEHQKSGAPRAASPDVVLVKFTLSPAVAGVAVNLFKNIDRTEEFIESSHELVAKAAGLQFKGKWRAEDKPGDSGVPVFRRYDDGQQKQGARHASVKDLRVELEAAGFNLDGVHTFRNNSGNQILVLSYRKGGKSISLRPGPAQFIDHSWSMNWGYATIWANIPEMVATTGGVQFKYIALEDRGESMLIQVTRPRTDEVAEIPKREIKDARRETVHTVNLGGSSPRVKGNVTFADGLWDVK